MKPKRRRGRDVGFVLHSLPVDATRPIRSVKALAKGEPSDVEVHSTRSTPAANQVFSANELEARLEASAEIVAQGKSLFKDGSVPDRTVTRNACWGCGKTTPTREDGRQTQASSMPGWVVQPFGASEAPEIWCPECAAMPGFGCVEEPEPREWGE